jgi:hypothetical protein
MLPQPKQLKTKVFPYSRAGHRPLRPPKSEIQTDVLDEVFFRSGLYGIKGTNFNEVGRAATCQLTR